MTTITNLCVVKDHLKIDCSSEDDLLNLYLEAAEAFVNDYCDTKDAPFTIFTPTIQSAVLLIVSDLYENRVAQLDKQLYQNKTVEMLLDFNRNF